MKKLVVMGLALTMALGITACSGGNSSQTEPTGPSVGTEAASSTETGKSEETPAQADGDVETKELKVSHVFAESRHRMNFMIRPGGGISWLFILTVHMEIIRTVLRHARWGLWISHVWTVRPTGWKQEACCLRHIALTATNIGSHLRRVIYVRRCAGKSVKQWEALIS